MNLRSFALALVLLAPLPAFCSEAYQYKARCWIDTPTGEVGDLCTVVETLNKEKFLKTRNIYSNRFALTVRSWFDPVKGFMTWDSYSQREYQWSYKIGPVRNGIADSYVMEGFHVENLTWD